MEQITEHDLFRQLCGENEERLTRNIIGYVYDEDGVNQYIVDPSPVQAARFCAEHFPNRIILTDYLDNLIVEQQFGITQNTYPDQEWGSAFNKEALELLGEEVPVSISLNRDVFDNLYEEMHPEEM